MSPGDTLGCALERWKQAAGPYWLYVNATPFLGPAAMTVRPTRPRRDPNLRLLLEQLRGQAVQGGVAAFLDLPAATGLWLSLRLNQAGWHAVPLVERWPADPAVLPSKALTRHLVSIGGRLLEAPAATSVAFVLDGERGGPEGLTGTPRGRSNRFDNRFHYSTHRFPAPSFLMANGVSRVAWCGGQGIAADLVGYVAGLRAADLEVTLVG